MQYLPSAKPEVRVELIGAIGERNITAGLEALLAAAKDEDRKVRLESFKVLKTVAGPDQLPALVRWLPHCPMISIRRM